MLSVLIQFVFRLTFGVALAMGVTSSRWVSAGFYRVHLWVLMGLNTLAALSIATQGESLAGSRGGAAAVLALAISLAIGSYVGAVVWLYEKARAGYVFLWAIMAAGGLAAVLALTSRPTATGLVRSLEVLDVVSSGLLLGITLAAMLLGHWYLNSPTMELRPLRRLVLLMVAAVVVRGVSSGSGLVGYVQAGGGDAAFWIFVSLRWLAGLCGPFLLAWMTWWTLKIPNTQSATGILYASVILTFIGELTSQFLSVDAPFPL